jgi:multicomponent Na+:H+ antiporter subunit D
LLAVAYVWKMIEVLYFNATDEREQQNTAVKEAPLMMLIPMWVLVLANIYFGFNTELTVGTAEQAVKLLMLGAN